MLSRLLEKGGYASQAAESAEDALATLAASEFDLVMTDMNMTGETGLDLLKNIQSKYPDVATIMVTGVDDPNLARVALETGAYGYVIKPFEANEILINVANALRRRALEMENRRHRERLEEMVKERTSELWTALQDLEHSREETRISREETIERLAIAAEFRDDETARHIHRMSFYCRLLAEKMGEDSERCDLIRIAAVMHDVGKIGIPDGILLKPGKLTEEEYEAMKQHSPIGHRILAGSSSDLLDLAATIALTHHEKIDGTGYPNGLTGPEIPIEGKIAAIADVFDALTTDRVYRKAFTLPESINIMKEGRGTHFDSDLLDLFLESLDVALQIKAKVEGGATI
jgi:putative two-component system response regulator